MIAPEWVAVSGFGRRRSLSDLAVWGFPETFPENLPPQALSSSFSPPRPSPPIPSPSNTSLQLSRSGLFTLSTLPTPFFLLQTLSFSLQPFLSPLSDPLRTPSESLHRVPQKALKGPKRPFLGLFRGFPKTPQKGLKTPFLTPFSPLPYPL